MNQLIGLLQPYPFQKLANLFADVTPPADKSKILLSLGEPKHAPPRFVLDKLASSLDLLGRYPVTRGEYVLRASIASWLSQRFSIPESLLDPDKHILPVAGTREALFSFAQAVFNASSSEKQLVIMPNPFYQIYEGAALLAGAKICFINNSKETNYQFDPETISPQVWSQTQLIYICTPGNPAGAVIKTETLRKLIKLAKKHDFVIASDECYSEIYFDDSAPPPGLLQAAIESGNDDFSHCIVFHSLSKRSNLPGLRSGFVAGDAGILEQYLQYRTYHGAALSIPTQLASVAAWSDEKHVIENRAYYREKFAAVLDILGPVIGINSPEAGFYIWLETPFNDEDFARQLYQNEHVVVLPGSYLSRETDAGDPGKNHVRMALVASQEECIEAAKRIRHFLESINR